MADETTQANDQDASQPTPVVTPTAKTTAAVPQQGEPVYLIHRGITQLTIPAVTVEKLVTDPEAEHFGEIQVIEIEPAKTVSVPLPKGSRYGSRKIGVPHEIKDVDEATMLRARGFQEATDAEIKAWTVESNKTDDVAEQARTEALDKLRRNTRRGE